MSSLVDLLSRHIPDTLFIDWLKQSACDDPEEMWTTCPRGSWLLQYVRATRHGQNESERKVLVRAAFECASLSLTAHKNAPAVLEMRDALEWYCRVEPIPPWDQNRLKLLDESDKALKIAEAKLGRGPWLAVVEAVKEAAKAAATAALQQPQDRFTGFKTGERCWRAAVSTENIGDGMAVQTAEIVRRVIQFDSLRSLDDGKRPA